ncbi:MAG: RidA family protein [Christensenellales bacterium]
MKNINTSKAPGAIGPYVQAKLVSNFLFTSGQIPVNPETGVIPEGIEAQTEQAMKNIKAIVEEAGGKMDDVVRTLCFLSDMGNFAAFNKVYEKFFPTDKPARSCVAVKEIPKNCMVEVECIAYIKP